MRDVVLRHGLSVVLLVAVGGLTWQVAALEGRLAALESVRSRPVTAPVVMAPSAPSGEGVARAERVLPRGGPPREASAALDLEDPEVRGQLADLVEETQHERMEQRRAEHIARFEAEVSEEVARFGEDHGLPAETTDEVLRLLGGMNDTRHALFADVRDGRITHLELRREMRAAHDDTEGALADLLGAELFADLEERVPFGPGGGPPPPPR